MLETLNSADQGQLSTVGHTHEDIDAFFGVLAKHLLKLDVYTLEGKYHLQIIIIIKYTIL